jgi:hypothetical protein
MNPANKVTYPRQHYLIFIPLLIGLALLFYKTNTSLRVLRSAWDSGSIASRPEVVAFGQQVSATGVLERSANYLLVVWPALVFGILIGARRTSFRFSRLICAVNEGAVGDDTGCCRPRRGAAYALFLMRVADICKRGACVIAIGTGIRAHAGIARFASGGSAESVFPS